MDHEGMEHTEGIRPSARGCHILCCRVSYVLQPVSVPLVFGGINLRHIGRDSRMVQCYMLFIGVVCPEMSIRLVYIDIVILYVCLYSCRCSSLNIMSGYGDWMFETGELWVYIHC